MVFLEWEHDSGGLGAYVGCLGPLLGPLWAVLGRSCGLCWRSWAAPGPLQKVLGRSWGLCWWSWAALGASGGGPGGSGAEKCEDMTIFKMCFFLEREHDLRPADRS